jgi:hypothetical protein
LGSAAGGFQDVVDGLAFLGRGQAGMAAFHLAEQVFDQARPVERLGLEGLEGGVEGAGDGRPVLAADGAVELLNETGLFGVARGSLPARAFSALSGKSSWAVPAISW